MELFNGLSLEAHRAPKPEPEKGKDGKELKKAPSMGGGMACPPDGPGKYSVYSRTRVLSEYPKISEPYATLSETFSYCDEKARPGWHKNHPGRVASFAHGLQQLRF